MIDTIDLSKYNFAFSESKLTNLKRKNFIYGKNGTGKSCLVKAIKEQYSDDYNVKVFNGWSGILKENDYLDAIALGEINASKQIEIDRIDEQIKEIDKKIIEPQDGSENLFRKHEKANHSYVQQDKKIQQFYTSSASKISASLFLGRSYDKRSFVPDIPKANKLSEQDLSKLNKTIKAEKISIGEKISFPKIDLKKYLEATNEILQAVVLPSGVINELTNNLEKQNFAKLGMKIHNREIDNELCSFCGSIISEDRWDELDRYFSDEVKELDRRILKGIVTIENCIKEIDDISAIDELHFYPEFKNSLLDLNLEIFDLKSAYSNFLNSMKEALEEKKGKTIIKIDELKMIVLQPFSELQTNYDELYDKNKKYSENLSKEQSAAKEKIRLHEVKLALDNFNYSYENIFLENLKTEKELLAAEISCFEDEKVRISKERKELVADTTKELSTVTKINKLLKGLGSHSFSLDYVESLDGQKGQYRVLGRDGNERSVQTLSDGEKNIVAFLWFMDSLEGESEEDENEKEKIVIFDDPMNSNDDNCQYLMMGVIQKFYRQDNHPQLFLMTHNNHFYLQVTPNSKKYPLPGKTPEQKYIKLLKTEDRASVIEVSKASENLKTIYEELWEELKYAYAHDKVIFMWNNMRRILETYNRFNFKNSSPSDIENEFDDSVDKVLAIALVKSLNVNSHIGYETDVDISGKTRDELKNIFLHVFEKLDAEKHFNCYWPD